MYIWSIYWQAIPKVKKKSDKQQQRLDKVRKRDERATIEKIEVQAKCARNIWRNLRGPKARVLSTLGSARYFGPKQNMHWKIEHTECRWHVGNDNLVFCCYICVCCLKLHQADYHVEDFFCFYFFVGRWVERGGGLTTIWWGSTALSSNVYYLLFGAVYWFLDRRGYFGVSNVALTFLVCFPCVTEYVCVARGVWFISIKWYNPDNNRRSMRPSLMKQKGR